MIRVVIVDDEAPARRRLRDLLNGVRDTQLVAECADGEEAIDAIHRYAPDLLYLDVQMPEISGFDVLDAVGARAVPVVVFVSAFDAHALRAFEHRALDYLLKPFTADRFEASLERAREQLATPSPDWTARIEALLAGRPRAERIAVSTPRGVRLIEPGRIVWLEADRNHVVLHTLDGVLRTRATLASFERRLGGHGFLRIHRSLIVHADHIVELGPWDHGERSVKLSDGTRLGSSRTYSAALRGLERG